MLCLTSSFVVINIYNLSSRQYQPFKAFNNNDGFWGGRKKDGVFFIGGETPFPSGHTLLVELFHVDLTKAAEDVKFMVENEGVWEEKCTMEVKRNNPLAIICEIPLSSL